MLALLAVVVLVVRGRTAAGAAREAARARLLGARLDGVGELTGAGLLVRASDGRVLEVDRRAARLLAVTEADAIGRTVGELPIHLVDDTGRPAHPGAVLGAVGAQGGRGGPAGAVVVGVARPDGTVGRRVRIESRPLPPAPGEGATVLVAVTEVGGARGDRSGVELHDAAQVAPVAIALADAAGRVLQTTAPSRRSPAVASRRCPTSTSVTRRATSPLVRPAGPVPPGAGRAPAGPTPWHR